MVSQIAFSSGPWDERPGQGPLPSAHLEPPLLVDGHRLRAWHPQASTLSSGVADSSLDDEPAKELPRTGQLLIVRLLNPHRDDDGREASSLVPRLVAFTLGGNEMPIPGLEALASSLVLGQRAQLTLPVGADLALPLSQVAGVPGFCVSTPLPTKVCVELELQEYASQEMNAGLGDGERPSEGDLAVIRVRNPRLRSGAPFAMPELVKFVIGSDEVIPGLDAAVAQMTLNEQAALTIPPVGGYGGAGSPGNIPPDATLLMDVELLGWS